MEEEPRKDHPQEDPEKDEQDYDTFMYRFQQQIIDAWKPVPYTKNNVILYAVLTVVCIATGLALILTAPTSPIVDERYDDQCSLGTCTVSFTLSKAMPAGSFLYYGFTNFFQNHRRYLKFFSVDQMQGDKIDEAAAKLACGEEAYTNSQLGCTTAFDGTTALTAGEVAYPCGQRAKTYLQAKTEIKSMGLKYADTSAVSMQTTNIAWPADKTVYKNSGSPTSQCIDIMDEDWLIWFRPGARSDWYKLKGKITDELPAGTYTFQATESYDISAFGQKHFYISTSNELGNKDYFLGIAFLSLGGGCLIVLIVFVAKLVTQIRERPKIN